MCSVFVQSSQNLYGVEGANDTHISLKKEQGLKIFMIYL